jgi:hypothetical protein
MVGSSKLSRQARTKSIIATLVFGCVIGVGAGCIEEQHNCDESKQIDFRVIGDVVGEWVDGKNGKLFISIDQDGHLTHYDGAFACEQNKLPLVVGDYNTKEAGIGYNRRTLVEADLVPGRFELIYDDAGNDLIYVGELIAPNHLRWTERSSRDLYRAPPADETTTDDTSASTNESASGSGS